MKPHKDMKLGGNAPMFRGVVAVLIAVAAVLAACTGYPDVKGVVVDADTGKPIEGAVVSLTGLSGSGGVFDSSSRAPLRETVTDAEGKFHLEGYTVAPSDVYIAIYKQGYACWNNSYIFNGSSVYGVRRTDYPRFGIGYTYRLVPWQEGWSYVWHGAFIGSALGEASPGPKMFEALRLQNHLASEERTRKGRM